MKIKKLSVCISFFVSIATLAASFIINSKIPDVSSMQAVNLQYYNSIIIGVFGGALLILIIELSTYFVERKNFLLYIVSFAKEFSFDFTNYANFFYNDKDKKSQNEIKEILKNNYKLMEFSHKLSVMCNGFLLKEKYSPFFKSSVLSVNIQNFYNSINTINDMLKMIQSVYLCNNNRIFKMNYFEFVNDNVENEVISLIKNIFFCEETLDYIKSAEYIRNKLAK